MWPTLCPICGGWGKAPKEYADFKTWITGFKVEEPKNPVMCQGCNGKGWVEVESNWGTVYLPGITTYPWYGQMNVKVTYGINTPDNSGAGTPP
jgi:RecJ-like exonuclease